MLPSEKYERAFEKIGRSFNYRLLFQAMTICSLSDKECLSINEIQAQAIALSNEFYSYFTKAEMFICECEVTEKSLYAEDFLNSDLNLNSLRVFFKAIEKTGLLSLDSRDNDLLYITNSEFSDVLYQFARLQNH